MNRLAWTACVAVIVLAGLGCRREGEGASRAYDANRDLATGVETYTPDKGVLADQAEISRRARDARLAAAPATPKAAAEPASSPAPAPEATTAPAPAVDANAATPTPATPSDANAVSTPPADANAAAPADANAA
jgi:hypothetical protein